MTDDSFSGENELLSTDMASFGLLAANRNEGRPVGEATCNPYSWRNES